ncbi:amino acid adenylation domain-containing protein, partial [Cupriavidus respiraculi]
MTRETLLDQLWHLTHTRPDATALTVLDDDHPEGLACTYRQLWSQAAHCASRLSTLAGPGDRVMLVMDTGMHYVSAFLGCLLSRMVAVPAFPPESLRPQHLARLNAIAKDAQPRVAVIDTALSRGWAEALPAGQLSTLDLSSGEVPDSAAASAFAPPAVRPENLAFLQYTSGSTATPKGVMVTHGNIVANQHAIASQFGTTADDIMVSWLPLYHDMGLIGSLLHPLYMGVPLVLMSPGYFLQRPRRWLDAIDRFGATISGGPDFAYRLCVERIRAAQAEALSLRSWRIAFCGAEPIRPDTLRAFADRFSAAGLDPGALYPCYGLAEATLLVSGGRPGAGATVTAFDDAALAAARVIGGAEGMRLVACGDTAPGHRVEIRDPETGRAVADGAIGELCISGPSVTAGYWQRPDAAAQVFGEDGTWLRSGDLGFRHDGQLYIAGRLKDLIVVRGHNVYPQDIEIAVEAGVDIVRKGRVAAFPATVAGAETIGIAAEIARGALKFGSPEAVERAIRETVAQACGEPPGLVLLLMPGELPKTTSGKLQRSRCLPAWRAGQLQVWAAFEAGMRAGDESSPPGSSVPAFTTAQARLAALWHEVLGVAPSTPRDSFFALGGDSVKAVQLVARIRERLHAGYALQDLFAEPALRDGAAMLDRLCADGSVAAQSKIARQQRDGDAPLSAAQRGLWVLWCMQPDSGAYNVSGVLKVQGRFDDEALRRTVDALVARHEALRTIIALDQHEEPRQRVLASYRCDIATLDLRAAGQSGDADSNGEGNAEYLARSRARTLSEQPFDLLAAPALRIARLRVADEREWLSITMHHIVSDGWSMNVLIGEFARLYEGFARGNPVQLPALPIRYTDYAAWHRDRLDGGELERQLAYWKSSLGSEPVVLDLPCDRARPAVPSCRGSAVDFSVAPALAGRLRALARQADTTLFTVLLAAYKVLLHRHTGQRDLRVGVPAANRGHVDTEGLVGFFVNTQVLRTEIDGTLPFATVLTRVREAVLEAQANQDVPFELVVDALQPDRNLAHNPLFQVKFNQALAIAAPARLAGHAVEAEQIEGDVTRFDLALDVSDQQTTISARFSYATDLFERETVQRLQGHYVAILEQVANDPQGVVGALALPCGTDGRLIAEASAEAVDVVTAWRRNVAEDPCTVALQVGDATLTRLQVDRLANAVAQALVARGVGVESTVGLCVERSFAFPIGWLGILKAGAVCVPLDPGQPVERLRQLLEDAGAGVVVGRLEGVESIDPDGLAPVDLAPAVTVVPDQAAYLIYTSGSTGTPKGVVVRHGALAHYVCGVLQRLNLPADASMAMVSTTAADLGHTVLFGALYSGRTLHLLPHDHAFDPDRFAAYMARHGVGVLKIVPSHLRALLQAGKPADVLPHAALILGGEATSADLAQTIRTLRPDCQLFNHYGPTETTVGVLTHHAVEVEDGPVPTGKPLPGSHVYVLDADLNPVPAGVAGELYIGGPQVARGYLNRPGLTAERFLPDPFVSGARMYRTGDRVKEDRQGRIHYLGRADEQVKIRGYRVELNEIAHMLRTQAGVVDAAVLVRDEKLVAYCVLTDTDPATLKAALKAHLPDHMVPAQIVPMDRLPVTPNGKLDRRALPEPVWETQGYVAPRNDTEALLAQVWQDVLGVEKVGITDNFFELGGDSILSIQAVSRARRAGLRFTPKDLFLHQSVQALAQVATAVKSPSVTQAVPRGDVPLLPVQTAFFESAIPNRHHWNQSALLRPVKPLDTSVLDRALHAVVAHHDALRLSFTQVDGQWKQHYADAVPADLLWQQSVADTAELTDACCRAQQSLRLDSGPLLRALHLRLPDGTERLFLAIHHLAVDGVSWRILLEDLQAAYAQAAHNQAIVLPARTTSYQAWARALIAYARQDAVLKHVGYWLAQQAPTLPCDRQPHQDRIADADTLTLRLSPERTRLLLTQAHAAYRTQINDLLLSALSQALGQWAGTDRAGILLEGHGREALSESTDLSRTVGWFTTVFPVALPVLHDPAQSIRQVKEALRAIPANGLGYGVLRYLGPEAVRHELAALDLPRLTFNYLGQFDQGFGDDALFARASEPHGAPRSPDAPLGNWITVNGQVAAGALELDFAFSTARYDRDTVAALVRACEAALDATIDHCLQAPAGALTPSDVPLAALTQAQLDRLPLDHAQIDDLYPLTPMQQGMLFHTLYTPEAGIYVNQL